MAFNVALYGSLPTSGSTPIILHTSWPIRAAHCISTMRVQCGAIITPPLWVCIELPCVKQVRMHGPRAVSAATECRCWVLPARSDPPVLPSGPPGAPWIPRVPSGPPGVSLDPPACPPVLLAPEFCIAIV